MNGITERHTLFFIGLCFACLTPLLLSNVELWDACYAEMAILRSDFSSLWPWATQLGWYGAYYFYVLFAKVAAFTGIHWKFFFNILTVVSLLGLAREIFWFAHRRFGLKPDFAWVAAMGVIAFPIWHTLVSTSIFINIFCFWIFMAAVRYWYSNKGVAILLFVLSAQLFSVFSLAVGVTTAEFLLTATKTNYIKKGVRAFCILLVLLFGFIVVTRIINVHGSSGTYNTINLDKLKYFYLLLIYCAALAASGFVLSLRIADTEERQIFLRRMLAVTALLLFAVLPYVAVGRPMRYFAFGSFTARHTLLTCVPISLLLAVLAHYLATTVGWRTARYATAIVLVASVVVLWQGYSHKAAALIFKDMLIQSLRDVGPPPSGYVGIEAVGYEAPRHVHQYAINLCLFKAYGRGAWRANGFWRRKMKINRASLEKIYSQDLADPTCPEVTGDAFTKYAFHLTGFHQEGRFWYWFYYVTSDYSGFRPQLIELKSPS